MDFSLNDTQTMLADSIDRFIDNDYAFELRQQFAASETGYSVDVWKTFADLGWTAVPFGEDDGGFDGSAIDTMLVMERFGRGLVVEPYLADIVLAGGVLKRIAAPAQRERWLHPIIAGELHVSLAFVEPQAGNDLANVETTAKADGADWLLNGHKGYVLNARNADWLIVPARTDATKSGTDGITLFVVEAGADGLAVHDYPTVDGQQAADVVLNDVRVPGDAVLGDPGRGFEALDAACDDATLAVCAEAVGIMNAMKDKTVAYAKNRIQFGVPIGSFQALQHRMVDMLTDCEQSRSLLMWATMLYAAGSDDAKRAVSAIKYKVGTTGRKVGEEAVQLHGGMGVTWELDIAHYLKRLTAIGLIFGNADWHLDRLAA
ncbi:MAG: acyl-CoA dehydrogenase [Woeseiaceae bacterium]|nr:acyl-CoA dehydrogenase [Woeseiaceae bacterium]